MRRSRTRGWHGLVAVLACALVASGCTLPSSGIDPSGQRILGQPGAAPGAPPAPDNCKQSKFPDYPGPPHSWADTAVIVTPQSIPALVGSEVILLAGVKGNDNCLRTNRRIEWSITEGSVGHFIEVGDGGCWDYVAGDFTKRRKVDNTYAIGSTSHSGVHLTRGTPAPTDDVYVKAGQGWVSLTSPIEGTSNVTVFAPDVYPWSARTQTATVHWIDCQFRCPTPGIRRAGSRHTLTTQVVRRDSTPCVGWRVRYEITGGPPAGFDPDGAPSVEVGTDNNGNASADLFQKQIGPGVNSIAISVVRPGELTGSGGRQLVIRAGATSVQWTADAPALPPTTPTTPPPTTFPGTTPGTTVTPGTAGVELKVSGPTQARVNDLATYRIDVTNRTQAALSNLRLYLRYEDGLQHAIRSPIDKKLSKPFAPGQVYPDALDVEFRVIKAGQSCFTVEIRGANDAVLASQRVCVVANDGAAGTRPEGPGAPGGVPSPASISVTKTGPAEAKVGDTIEFSVDIANNGGRDLTNIQVVDRYDPSLKLLAATGGYRIDPSDTVVSWTIERLKPGDSKNLRVKCSCETAATRTCNRVNVDTAEGVQGKSEACLQVKQPAATFPGELFPGAGTPPGGTASAAADKLAVSIRSLQPSYQVGKDIPYRISVTNLNGTVQHLLKVEVTVPEPMTIGAIGTTGPGTLPPVIRGKTVTFDKVAEIRPNETLVFNVRATAAQAGAMTVSARVTSHEQPRPVAGETTTEVKP